MRPTTRQNAGVSLLLTSLLLLAGCASTPSQGSPPPKLAGDPLVVMDMDGVAHDLGAALERGETVAFVFWQTWCASCRAEAPAITQAVADHSDAIRFVGVVPGSAETVDDGEVKETAVAWNYAGFPQVRDTDMRLSRRFEVKGTPTIVVLGKGGEVHYSAHRPPGDWTTFRGAAVRGWGPNLAREDCVDGVCPLPPAR